MSSRSIDAGPSRGPTGRTIAAALAGGAVLVLGGCLTLDLPRTFVVESSGTSEFRAVTADDGILVARDFSDPNEGTFEFWTEALRADFIKNRGYTLLAERPVKDREGRDGLELTFEVTALGIPHRYLVTLFVLEGWLGNEIRVVEFAAPKEAFERHVESVRAAIRAM